MPPVMGHWQKEVPKKSGYYWTATRDGFSAGLASVQYDGDRLIYAGMRVEDPEYDGWGGWWWSEPVQEPTPPPRDEWSKQASRELFTATSEEFGQAALDAVKSKK